MFRLIHWLTCKHKDVHRLPKPRSLKLVLVTGKSWTEQWIQESRMYSLHRLAILEQYRLLSVPTPGLKDVTTGLPWPPVSLASDPTLLAMAVNMWGCSRYGRVMVTATPGSLKPTIVRLQHGS